ncbi:MAG: hypothetical protein Q4G03_09385 [Planctomycetia bacterium]|nr:hypothetical protein [Planctomycetia bacterium]
MTRNVLVAMSGGVDSGTSAALLLNADWNVRGLFMRHAYQATLSWEETRDVLTKVPASNEFDLYRVDQNGELARLSWTAENFPFCLPRDFASALDVANFLNVPLVLLDLSIPFNAIVENFIEEYYAARTPNPCALCNRLIKFGLLWRVAQELGATSLATGHYVRKESVGNWSRQFAPGVVDSNEEFSNPPEWLLRDPSENFFTRSPSPKDQSYFLYGAPRSVLPYIQFPVGEMEKPKVRELAKRIGLPVATKKDSQEICFVPDDERLAFIKRVRDANPERWSALPSDSSGEFLSLDGKKIGEHHGYEKYTIGQRKGLGMGFGERIFVQRVDPVTHAVTLGPYEALGRSVIRATHANWHADVPMNQEFRCQIKIRYRNESCTATVVANELGEIVVRTDSPRFAVAPGQALVCYWRDRLLGGGKIEIDD